MLPLQTDEIRYDIMVERLFPDYQPAKPLWPVHKRLVLWLALEFGIVVAGFAVHRPDLLQRLRSTQYLLELGAFLAMGTGAAVLALRTAIPGCEPNRYELSVIPIVALTAIGLIACEHSIIPVSVAQFIRAGIQCTIFTGTVAVVPWIGLFWAVRRGAPLAPLSAGALIGMATFSFAFALGRLCCPIEDSLHFLIWHMLPGVGGVLLSISAASAWLPRRSLTFAPKKTVTLCVD
jgi:hypothetical protein